MSDYVSKDVDTENVMLRRSKRLSGGHASTSTTGFPKHGNKRGALVDISNNQHRLRRNKMSKHGKVKAPKRSRATTQETMIYQDKIEEKVVVFEDELMDGIVFDDSFSEDSCEQVFDEHEFEDEMVIEDSKGSTMETSILSAAREVKGLPSRVYEVDIYSHLLSREEKYMQLGNRMLNVQNDINHTMRSILIDWLVEVSEEYKLHRQTLCLTVNYIDRLLSDIPVNRTKLQLVGVSAMLLASKYEEIYPPSVDEFVYISDNTYNRDEVIRMESVLLRSLKFQLTVPTPEEFLMFYNRMVDLSQKELFLARYLVDLSAQEPFYLRHTASKITASAVILARYDLFCDQLMPTGFEFASRYNLKDLEVCVRELHCVHKKHYNQETTLKAVHSKYLKPCNMEVAKIQPRKL